jgi:metallo-beta-lactamase superfamily protein
MKIRLLGLLAFLTLTAGTARAQMMAREHPPLKQGYVDPRSVLEAAAKNIGLDKLKCVTYSGSGYVGAIGQNRAPMDDWPKVQTKLTKTINYEAKTAREEQLRKTDDPDMMNETVLLGTGAGQRQPDGMYRQVFMSAGGYAWNMVGNTVVPEPGAAEHRALEIVLTPHGFLRAALADKNAKGIQRLDEGRLITQVAIQVGKYRVVGSIDGLDLVERVQTWVPSPVLGDMRYDNYFTVWKTFGDVKFPTRLHHHYGPDDEMRTPRWFNGYNAFQFRLDVQPNACGEPVTVPDAVRTATIPPVHVDAQKLADGVWYMGGSTHNSVAVEFKDFVAVFEAPLDEERSLAVIGEIEKRIPGKAITYVINTHHHFDHLGGVRTYAQAGATIITQVFHRDFYWHDLLNPAQRMMNPDILSLFPPEEILDTGYIFEPVAEKYVLTDGSRTMEIYHVQGQGEKDCRLTTWPGEQGCEAELKHSENLLMAWLPKEKIVMEAELYNPPAPGEPPATAGDSEKAFYFNVKDLNLDVATIAPVHGRPVPWSDFLKVVGK